MTEAGSGLHDLVSVVEACAPDIGEVVVTTGTVGAVVNFEGTDPGPEAGPLLGEVVVGAGTVVGVTTGTVGAGFGGGLEPPPSCLVGWVVVGAGVVVGVTTGTVGEGTDGGAAIGWVVVVAPGTVGVVGERSPFEGPDRLKELRPVTTPWVVATRGDVAVRSTAVAVSPPAEMAATTATTVVMAKRCPRTRRR
jgi:hypothetical protein